MRNRTIAKDSEIAHTNSEDETHDDLVGEDGLVLLQLWVVEYF